MKLSKEQIESMHTLLVRERPMGTSVAAVDELIRLALLGLEHDRIVAERDARPDISAEDAGWFVRCAWSAWLEIPGEVRGRIYQAIRSYAADSRCAACDEIGGQLVECSTCGRFKGPMGRSAPMGSDYCGFDCDGYTKPPRPGQLWPGERYGDSLPCVHAPKVVKP